MEPRSCKRGNLYLFLTLTGEQHASMEPRSCKRGNLMLTECSLLSQPPLQWNHAHVSVEMHLYIAATLQVRRLQWNHAHVSVEISDMSLDNAALLALQWNHAHVSVEIHTIIRNVNKLGASMEPRSCKRGNHRSRDGR